MKKVYFLSDIHANLPALEAVINDIGKDEFENSEKYFLGDYVHFSPYNDEVLSLLSKLENANFIEGNHDIYCSKKKELDQFRKYKETLPELIQHIDWTREQISKKNLDWLSSHPKQIELKWHNKKILLFHGHLENTGEIVNIHDKVLQLFDFVICGHSHKPRIDQVSKTTIINVGSVR